ncbi:MAG: polysaccharide deacetylase family protein [Acidobacteria bacterium]|nr:polysaccharide deacetylase family protein [Acidobacteriota bacterium]
MRRRDLFKLMGITGLGLSHFGMSSAYAQQKAAVSQAAAQPGAIPAREQGRPNVFNWPFEEVRIPFRERKGKVKWPNNARLAVRIYITAEWDSGAENFSTLTGNQGSEGVYERPNLYMISQNAQYTFTVGIYRAIEVVNKYGFKISVASDGGAVVAYPDLHKEMHNLGWEIMARSWDHSFAPYLLKKGEEEGYELKRITDGIAKVTGERPSGWLSPGGRGTVTWAKLLADSGYLYTSDLNGDDIPYGLKFGDKTLVVIPHRQFSTNDFHTFLGVGTLGFPGIALRDVQSAFDHFRRVFDAWYETAGNEFPSQMLYGIHPYWSCLPDRIAFHDKALAYMKGFKDVWFPTHKEMAQYWKETYLA